MSWIAALAEIMAKWIVGNHNKWGHAIHILSGILWSIVALQTGMYALLVITIPAFVINIRNFVKWHHEEKHVD